MQKTQFLCEGGKIVTGAHLQCTVRRLHELSMRGRMRRKYSIREYYDIISCRGFAPTEIRNGVTHFFGINLERVFQVGYFKGGIAYETIGDIMDWKGPYESPIVRLRDEDKASNRKLLSRLPKPEIVNLVNGGQVRVLW